MNDIPVSPQSFPPDGDDLSGVPGQLAMQRADRERYISSHAGQLRDGSICKQICSTVY